jgi:hypothetical protein
MPHDIFIFILPSVRAASLVCLDHGLDIIFAKSKSAILIDSVSSSQKVEGFLFSDLDERYRCRANTTHYIHDNVKKGR